MMANTFLKKSCQGLGGLTGTEGRPRAAFLVVLLVAVLWLVPGCPTPPEVQELKKEVKALKSEVAGLKEQIIQVEAGQKFLMELVKTAPPSQGPATAIPETAVPGAAAGQPVMPGQPQPTAAEPITMEELFKNKDQLLGTRVTVKGIPGPVLMHKKTLFLGGPKGMVEVIYGNLQDKQQVERLTAQNIDTPITVSGLLSAAPGQTKEPVRLIIMADMVEF